MATRPASRPCSLREKLHVAPMEATSMDAASASISAQTSLMALSTICGTVMSNSLPKTDW